MPRLRFSAAVFTGIAFSAVTANDVDSVLLRLPRTAPQPPSGFWFSSRVVMIRSSIVKCCRGGGRL
jgi:hypothetical protein